ncbi:hypothetical protein ACPF8X_27910 [Streptomyces sp. G35A]
MPEHDTIRRAMGATALTLVAVACAAGLARTLRRGHGLRCGRPVREHARALAEAVRRHARHETPADPAHSATATPARPPAPAIPGQRQTGPRAETVRLTPAERAAFAGLVRRLTEGR